VRTAIVHDWLVTHGGAEAVLEQLLMLHPEADLFTLVDHVPPAERGFLGGHTPRTSPLQRAPWVRRRYRAYLPLMPVVVEQFDLSAYDVVISSSYAVAKGVLARPDAVHVSYCHSPMRYAWDLQHQYLRESGLGRGVRGWAARYMLHRLRLWDARSADGVDTFVANSRYVAQRIRRAYRRDSVVVYPPVDVERFTPGPPGAREDFYVTVSRLVPYKRVDLLLECFATTPERRLLVVGDGPDLPRLQRAAPPNVTLLGRLPHDALLDLLQRARAFVFAAEEDFGIVLLEAQACGTPVVAFGRGGALEAVSAGDARGRIEPTGLFFAAQTVGAVSEALARFEAVGGGISEQACRANAERFAAPHFRAEMRRVIDTAIAERG
jgi:glycosyltransferase involved in cell wall biosynthesis